MARDLVACVDLGGTKVHAALGDPASGGFLVDAIAETDTRGGEAVCAQIGDMVRGLARSVEDGPRIVSAALGVPGVPNPATGAILHCPNVGGLDVLDARAALAKQIGAPTIIDNDVKLATLGEMSMGCGAGEPNFILVSLGTGIGAGIVVDGRLLRGAQGAAGEIGYMHAALAGRASPATLESRVGTPGIRQTYRRLGGDRGATARDVFLRARAGEGAARCTLDEVGRELAAAIVSLAWIVDPALIVLAGSIGLQPELVGRLREDLPRHLGRPLRVEPSALENRGVLHGALALAARQREQSKTEREES